MLKLENGQLFVKGEMTDVFEVIIKEVSADLMVTVYLEPNEYTAANGVEVEMYTVDILNETVAQVLKEEGYMVVTQEQIKSIQA